MLFRRKQPSPPPIGLHVGLDAVRMLQLSAAAGRASVAAAHVETIPPAAAAEPAERFEAASQIVRRAFRKHPFVGRRVVTALPAEVVRVRTFRLPAATSPSAGAAPPTREAIEREACEQAKDVFSFATGSSVRVESVLAGEVRQGGGQGGGSRYEIIALAAGDDDVSAILGALARSGAAVESLGAEPFAIYRAAAWGDGARGDGAPGEPAGGGETRAVVHVSSAETQVVIGRGADVEVIRKVEVGAAALEQAAARKLGVTPREARDLRSRAGAAGESQAVDEAVFDATRPLLEALAREVALCLRYHAACFRARFPQSVRLLGPGAADPHLRSVLGATTALPIDAAGVFRSISVGKAGGVDPADAGWAIAQGLALKGNGTGPAPRMSSTAPGPAQALTAEEALRA